jgi:DNA-binding MarR family transcriptional regulator
MAMSERAGPPARDGQSGRAPDGDTDGEAAALVDAARRLTRAAARAAGPGERRELTGAQMELLVLVRRRPDLPVAEAAAALRLARNTVSTLVGQLDAAGLVERRTDPADGRVVRLRLTPAAEERMARWRARRVAAVRVALERLGDADRAALKGAVPVLARAAALLEDLGEEL